VTTVVAGGIALVKPFAAASRPFLRDVIFYMVAVFLTFLVLYFGYITLGEALGEHHGGAGVGGQPRGPITSLAPRQGTWGSTSSMSSLWCCVRGFTAGSVGMGRPPPGHGSQVRSTLRCWGDPSAPPTFSLFPNSHTDRR